MDENARGNAILGLGLGHLSRTEGLSDRSSCIAVIRAGLQDESEFVRGQTNAAADDVEQFQCWAIREDHGYER